MEIIPSGKKLDTKTRYNRTVVEIFSKERISFVKKKSFVKITTVFGTRFRHARCTALQPIFQARIQEARDGGNPNYDVTYGVYVKIRSFAIISGWSSPERIPRKASLAGVRGWDKLLRQANPQGRKSNRRIVKSVMEQYRTAIREPLFISRYIYVYVYTHKYICIGRRIEPLPSRN